MEGVLVDLYERMRGRVLSGFGGLGGTAGLGILMTQGMGAWILKCREFMPVFADEDRHDVVTVRLPLPLESQVAAIIAGMVLNHSRRELR